MAKNSNVSNVGFNNMNKWETVGKPTKNKKSTLQNSSKNQRKALKDNLPKAYVACKLFQQVQSSLALHYFVHSAVNKCDSPKSMLVF